MSKPVRSGVHFLIRQRDRIRNLGGPRGILHKLDYKKREREAMKQFGTASFPDAEQAAKERETEFPRMVKISILVPLWNNKREYQIELLESVMNQTYQNWELCLADGSDDEHAYVGEISKEYAGRSDGRIKYEKLDKKTIEYTHNYLNNWYSQGGAIAWEFIRMAQSSVADLCIIPIQDYLCLDSKARINTPSTVGENFKWRLVKNQLSEELMRDIKTMVEPMVVIL